MRTMKIDRNGTFFLTRPKKHTSPLGYPPCQGAFHPSDNYWLVTPERYDSHGAKAFHVPIVGDGFRVYTSL